MACKQNHSLIPRFNPSNLKFNQTKMTLAYKAGAGGSVAGFIWSYPLFHKWSYFEIDVIKLGRSGTITIGLCQGKYSLTQQPGWDRHSIGYHGDDGKLFQEDGSGVGWKGTPYEEGDRIGCGIDFEAGISSSCSVYFTKNGELIDTIANVRIPNGGLYPMVGMHSPGEKARLNLLPEAREAASDPDGDVAMGELVWTPSLYCSWRKVNTNIFFEENGTILSHMGGSSPQDDISLAQWHVPISRTLNCFQIEILQVNGAVAVGFTIGKYNFMSFPGWETNSIAYHSDDGKMFNERGFGAPYGDACKAGDVMAVWACFKTDESDYQHASQLSSEEWMPPFHEDRSASEDSDSGAESSEEDVWEGGSTINVFFSKNGHKYKQVSVKIAKGGFFPTVGLLKNGDKVRVTMQPYSG